MLFLEIQVNKKAVVKKPGDEIVFIGFKGTRRLVADLDRMAKAEGASRSFLIRRILRAAVSNAKLA